MHEAAKLSIGYYDVHAADYAAESRSADLSRLVNQFLAYLPAKETCGTILDLGCGSGRDSKTMLALGYDVDVTDGSAEMCKVAAEYLRRPVRQMLFSQLDAHGEYAGIWACASLLHVSKADLGDVLSRCREALEPGGVMYASFQIGEHDGQRRGRHYSDFREEEAVALFEESGLAVIATSITDDSLPGRPELHWLNVFSKRDQTPR